MTNQLLRSIRVGSVFALLGGASFSVAKAQDSPVSGVEETQIVNILKAVFVAARADDVAKFDSLVTPEFYLYEGGVRFDGDAIMRLVKKLHAGGARYEWNVTQPDVHVSGNSAWVAYVNQGSVTDSTGTKPVTWLESAVLRRVGRDWKIVFMTSTRAPARPAAQGQ